MIRLIAMAVVFTLSVALSEGAEATPVAVTITKRAPIETLSPTGDVVGVAESTVGTKFNFVSAAGSQVILEDAQGAHYRIDLGSTDYSPTPATPMAPTNIGPPAVPPPVVTHAASAPAPPVNPSPTPPANPTTAPDKQTPLADSPVLTVKIGDRQTANEMSVWPQGGLPGRPLLIAAHGNGGSGPKEIKGWLRIAKEHRFTIVCPSFLSSVNCSHLSEDDPYFSDCLRWIKANLQYNGDAVFMTGFSGGGFPTWYLATKRPDFFHGLIFQSCNFFGGYYDLELSHWFNKPIKLIWGSQDLPNIPVQNNQALEMLKSADCKDYTTEIVPGGHHQEHQDKVVSWMEQNLTDPASN